MANKKAKASKDSAPKDVMPKDVIIEGEVSARDDEAPASHKTAPQKPAPQKINATGSIFAILFSVMALGVASFVIYERQSSADAIDEKLGLFAAQMAVVQNQAQAKAQAQAEKIASVEVALQEAILAKPERNLATNLAANLAVNQRQAAGFIALMMWQDMRNGQALDDYQPFIMTLSDEEAKARLTNVIAAWQALDYQGLLAQGRGFLNDRPVRLGDRGDGGEIAQEDIQEEGILSGVSKWIAAVVKLEPLETQQKLPEQKLPSQQITEQASLANAYGLDEMLGEGASLEGPEIAAWREAVKQVAIQQERLSALVIEYLTDGAIMP